MSSITNLALWRRLQYQLFQLLTVEMCEQLQPICLRCSAVMVGHHRMDPAYKSILLKQSPLVSSERQASQSCKCEENRSNRKRLGKATRYGRDFVPHCISKAADTRQTNVGQQLLDNICWQTIVGQHSCHTQQHFVGQQYGGDGGTQQTMTTLLQQ